MHKTTPGKVTGNKYGEDLAEEKRSAESRDYTDKRKSYGEPQKAVQGKLEAIGGGSAEAASFPLY